MARKKKVEVIEVTKPGDEYESYEVVKQVILQEPKVTEVARLRALKSAQNMRKRNEQTNESV